MIIKKIIQQFDVYSKTPDYINGVIVEITGIAIEILLLAILVPIFLYLFKLWKSRRTRFIGNFYLFQIFHKISRIFLSLASIKDILPLLLKEMEEAPGFEIKSHYIYGNLENVFFVLKSYVFSDPALLETVRPKELDEIRELGLKAENIINEIDRLISVFIAVSKTKNLLFEIRLRFYPIRDALLYLENAIQDRSEAMLRKTCYDLETIGSSITYEMENVFIKERKLIDSYMRNVSLRHNLYNIVNYPKRAILGLKSRLKKSDAE